MGTCAKNLHMTGLHCIQVVDHFKRWTILVLNRNVLGMWTIGTALLCIRVIPSHFNKSFHMTISELDETWYASSTFGFVTSDKISLSFIVWFPG